MILTFQTLVLRQGNMDEWISQKLINESNELRIIK